VNTHFVSALVCYSGLQCVIVCYSVLQCVAVCLLQCVAACGAVRCSVQKYVMGPRLMSAVVCCSVLQYVACVAV